MDLGLSSNEVLLFDTNQCILVEKSKFRDKMIITQSLNAGRPDMGAHFEAKETFGNSLRAKIAAREGYMSRNNCGALSPRSRVSHQDF